ncbi:hypothetical protein TREES_T100003905 [Tupaia chinensis]|uniref:Uncharacterized protein n=1 Tax=Tupaia chinensis TaxID=246437 RepID=L9KYS7_TUPCH|nr:hypothetical protein TREES_T100003905 [Tupaia chinensis]
MLPAGLERRRPWERQAQLAELESLNKPQRPTLVGISSLLHAHTGTDGVEESVPLERTRSSREMPLGGRSGSGGRTALVAVGMTGLGGSQRPSHQCCLLQRQLTVSFSDQAGRLHTQSQTDACLGLAVARGDSTARAVHELSTDLAMT